MTLIPDDYSTRFQTWTDADPETKKPSVNQYAGPPGAHDYDEEWRPAPAEWPGYEVSSLGRVRNAKGALMREKAYPEVRVRNAAGRAVTVPVHRLVALTFLGPRPDPKAEILHRDCNSMNPRASNLKYGTRAENAEMFRAAKREGKL